MSSANQFDAKRSIYRKPVSGPQISSPNLFKQALSIQRSCSLKKIQGTKKQNSLPILDQCQLLSDESLVKKYKSNIIFQFQVQQVLKKVEKRIPSNERKKKKIQTNHVSSEFSTIKQTNKEEEIRHVNFYVRCTQELKLLRE